jgi:arabinan endo-1,5-alpha-L-arabinosidase
VFTDGEGNYFMAHQGRLASESALMDLHVRRILFTPDGWPVVSPQRYAGVPQRSFSAADLEGEWEIVRIVEPRAERRLEAGQILWGEGALLDGEWNIAEPYTLANAGVIAENKGSWQFDEKNQLLSMTLNGEKINNLIIFAGHDWERRLDTVLFTGLDDQGRSVWGKRTK